MSIHRLISRSLPLVGMALVGVTAAAGAQWNNRDSRDHQELFEWRGGVDREVQIVMRGNRVWTNNVGRTEPNNERSRAYTSLPRQDGQVVVRLADGRGDVDVLQQPTRGNGYTAIVRIRDPRSGSDNYRLVGYWQNYSNGDIYRGGRADERSRGRRGDEMGRRDRDDDRDHDRDRGRDHDDDRDWDRDNGNRRQSVLHWTGNVDDELEIRLQNGRVSYRTLRGATPTGIRVNAANANMPRSNAQLHVSQSAGRGQISIVQQPNQWNGYTTVLRIRDPQGGYGYYDFDLVW